MKKFKKWIENFWYHHKWPTIIISFFTIVLVIGITQIVTEKNGYHILYAGGNYLNKDVHEKIEEVFDEAAEEVSNTTGQKGEDLDLQMLVYLSEERVKKLEKEAEEKGEKYIFDSIENDKIIRVFMKQISSGETVIMFLDPDLYDTAELNDALYPVKDILKRDIPGTLDSGLGIKLSESGITEKYPELKSLPDNTIVCFKKVTHAMKLIGKDESQDSHTFQLDVARELFKGIGE